MSARGRGVDAGASYFAGALSLVFHPCSPHVPTFRSDIRYFAVCSPIVISICIIYVYGRVEFPEVISLLHCSPVHLPAGNYELRTGIVDTDVYNYQIHDCSWVFLYVQSRVCLSEVVCMWQVEGSRGWFGGGADLTPCCNHSRPLMSWLSYPDLKWSLM